MEEVWRQTMMIRSRYEYVAQKKGCESPDVLDDLYSGIS